MYTTYPQNQNYGPQHTGYGYAPMQQPMPMQAPMAAPGVLLDQQRPADDRGSGSRGCRRVRRGLPDEQLGSRADRGLDTLDGVQHPLRDQHPVVDHRAAGRPGLPGHREQPGPLGAGVHPLGAAHGQRPGSEPVAGAEPDPGQHHQARRHQAGGYQAGRHQAGRRQAGATPSLPTPSRADTKPADTKPADTKPADTKPARTPSPRTPSRRTPSRRTPSRLTPSRRTPSRPVAASTT